MERSHLYSGKFKFKFFKYAYKDFELLSLEQLENHQLISLLFQLLSYEGVYARHYTNSTTMQYGYLNMVLPFLTVIITPLICSLADRRRAHRSYFTISLVITFLSMASYAFLPIIMKNSSKESREHSIQSSSNLLIGPWIYYCLISLICNLAVAINTCLSDSFAVLQAEECKTSFGRVIVWGTFGWAASALVLSFINQWAALPRLLPGLVFGTSLLALDVVIMTFWPHNMDFKLDLIPIDAAKSLTGSASSSHKEPSDYMPLNESARINLGSEIDIKDGQKHRKTRSPVEIVLENLADDRQQRATTVVNLDKARVMLDGSTTKTLNSEIKLTNESKQISDKKSETLSNNLTPPDGIFLMEECQNTVSTISERDNNDVDYYNRKDLIAKDGFKNVQIVHEGRPSCVASLRIQILILGLIMKRRKSLIRFFILFVLSGFFMSMHWNYFFLYLDRIYHKQFEFISAFSMITQSLLGELPIFMLSRYFIDWFGQSHTLSISIISIGLRFILYAYFLPNVNMYFIAIADAFQGPNYGLFYVVMTEVGLEFSYCDNATIEKLAKMGELDPNDKSQVDGVRLALRSTIQSVAFACYEGIGVGLGSVIGGWLVASHGFETLWLLMAFGSVTVGMINLIVEFLCKEHDPETDNSPKELDKIEVNKTVKATVEAVADEKKTIVTPMASTGKVSTNLEAPNSSS